MCKTGKMQSSLKSLLYSLEWVVTIHSLGQRVLLSEFQPLLEATMAKKTAPTVSNIEAAQAALLASIKRRIDNAPNANQADNLSTEFKFFEGASGARILEAAAVKYEIDIQAIADQISVLPNENKDRFLAVYALQKVRKAIYALANDTKSAFDGYTNSILFNMANLQAINNKEARMSLCKAIEYTELEQVQGIRRLLNCSEGTASTQASSTRMMLRALGVGNVVKRKAGDSISFTDSKAAQGILAMYATKA